MRVGSLVLLVTFAHIIPAQDSDTVLLKDENHKFTLLSQIQDRSEAASFLGMLNAATSHGRFELAQTFVQKYSQSWLLAQAHDLLAKSAIDLGNYDSALASGRFSLRLQPENPSLLILMANVEAQRNQLSQAINDANDALEYLLQIERPPNLTQAQWKITRPQMEASAYFARSRAETSEGMSARSQGELQKALADLNCAAAWNGEDPEIFYLRAVIEIQLGQKNAAASDLAYVYRSGSALAVKAKKILLILAKQSATSQIEEFVKTLPARTIDPSLRRENSKLSYSNALNYGYVGPQACRSCHMSEYAAWRKTGMARMLQPYRPENLLADFTATTSYNEGDGSASIRMGMERRPYFELRDLGVWKRFYVDFTIGSKWQQAYVTKLSDGELQVLPIEYNVKEKAWINYWKIIDPPGSQRANIKEFAKLSDSTNYQQNCAICHTSQLKADVASTAPMLHATFVQPGIDCEMCHGPAAWHVKQASSGEIAHADPDEPPIDFRRVSNRDGVRVCAQCHRQSAVREIGDAGELNYSSKEDFVPVTWARPYDAFSRKALYKDGRFRETTFIVEAFTRSACYRRGTAQCATCHSPHLGDFDTNKTSLKFQRNSNEMCLPCHEKYRDRVSAHTRHAQASEASQCISCHMPRIVNALLFKARSHQIEIPTADLTQRFGQEDSPNVCLTCHSEKGPDWAQEQLARWPRN